MLQNLGECESLEGSNLFMDRDGPEIERLSLGILSQFDHGCRQVVNGQSHLVMFPAQRLGLQGQSLSEEGFGLLITVLLAHDHGKQQDILGQGTVPDFRIGLPDLKLPTWPMAPRRYTASE